MEILTARTFAYQNASDLWLGVVQAAAWGGAPSEVATRHQGHHYLPSW